MNHMHTETLKNTNTNVYIEVNSVIENLSQEEKEKLPKKLIRMIKEKAGDITIPIYNGKSLDEQISREAVIILTCISTKYLFSYEEKQLLKYNLVKNSIKT